MVNINKMKIRGRFEKIINVGHTVNLWEFSTLQGKSIMIGVHRLQEVEENILYDIIASLQLRERPTIDGHLITINIVTLLDIQEVKQKNLEGVGVNE